MIAIAMAIILSLSLNVLSGSLVFLFWNYGPATIAPIPEIDWSTGLASFLLIRLVASPPKIKLDFKHKTQPNN